MQVIQPTLFDYAAIDAETRIVVQQEDKEFDRNMGEAGSSFVRGCHNLLRIHDQLRYMRPGFVEYCRSKPDMAERTAYRMLDVAKMFAESANISASREALYLLGAPSTPQAARDEAIERAQAGESITHTAAREITANHTARDKAVKSELAKLDPNERYIVGQRVDLVTSTAQEIHQAVERYKAEEVIGPERAQAEAEYAEAKRVNEFLHRITAVRQWMDALAAEEPIMDSDHPGPSLADAMFEWSEAIRAAASRVAVRYMSDSVQPRLRRIK